MRNAVQAAALCGNAVNLEKNADKEKAVTAKPTKLQILDCAVLENAFQVKTKETCISQASRLFQEAGQTKQNQQTVL